MMHLARRLLGYLALAGLVVSLVAHIWASFGKDIASAFPQIWLMHVGVFVVFVPLIFMSRHDLGLDSGQNGWTAGLPGWAKILGVCVLAYAALNFLLVLAKTGGGSPVAQEGAFVLLNHLVFQLASPWLLILRCTLGTRGERRRPALRLRLRAASWPACCIRSRFRASYISRF